jgi:general secretion pathway protein C
MILSPRYLVVVNLLLLAMAAYAAAGIAGTALAARLIPPADVALVEPPAPAQIDRVKPATYYALIHQRDIFNSVKPVEAPPVAEAPKKTQLKVRLWGVAVRGLSSHCVIEDQSARPPKQELYKIGDMVAGIAKVKSIEWDKVILEHDGAEEILELVPDPTSHAAAAVAATLGATGMTSGSGAPSSPGSASRPGAGPDVNVQVVGDNQYVIDRDEVDKAFENLGQLFTQMRAVPHFEGGKAVGFRLFAIRSGSLFDKIGLRNGDIVKRINAIEMNDPSRALAMLEELRNERSLTVDVIRNRQDQTLSYTVR